MHARFVAVVIVSASLFVIGAAALLDVLDAGQTPSAELCATQWNRSINRENRAFAARRHFGSAVVTGWLAQDRFPGCSVLFRHGDGRPWFLFGGGLLAGRLDRWDLVTGERWGFDSPEEGPETVNAIVTADGLVRLIEV